MGELAVRLLNEMPEEYLKHLSMPVTASSALSIGLPQVDRLRDLISLLVDLYNGKSLSRDTYRRYRGALVLFRNFGARREEVEDAAKKASNYVKQKSGIESLRYIEPKDIRKNILESLDKIEKEEIKKALSKIKSTSERIEYSLNRPRPLDLTFYVLYVAIVDEVGRRYF